MNNEKNCERHVEDGVFDSIAHCMNALHSVKGGKRRRASHKSRASHKRRASHKSRASHKRRTHKRRH